MKKLVTYVFALVLAQISMGCGQGGEVADAQNVPSPGSHTPGPYIVQIDYDALYRMPNPPEYQPFDFYGAFLFSLAKQQTPMAVNLERPTPDNVSQTLDVVFKNIDGIKLGLDLYQPSNDDSPNPLILITAIFVNGLAFPLKFQYLDCALGVLPQRLLLGRNNHND